MLCYLFIFVGKSVTFLSEHFCLRGKLALSEKGRERDKWKNSKIGKTEASASRQARGGRVVCSLPLLVVVGKCGGEGKSQKKEGKMEGVAAFHSYMERVGPNRRPCQTRAAV